MHEKILILDFGAQYTQLIARRVREAQVYCEIHPHDVSDDFVRGFGAKGVILSGSHMSAYEESTARAPAAAFDLGVPVLGICYGMQTMAQQLGGRVEAGKVREFGYAEVRARGHTRLLDGIQDFADARGPRHAEGVDEPRRQGHRASARLPPHGLHRSSVRSPGWRTRRAASTRCSSIPRLRTRAGDEAAATGSCCGICGCRGDWNTASMFPSGDRAGCTDRSGDDQVMLGLAAASTPAWPRALPSARIGEQFTRSVASSTMASAPGRERAGHGELRDHMDVRRVSMSRDGVLSALKGLATRKRSARPSAGTFIEVFDSGSAEDPNAQVARQGTIYPDVIESAWRPKDPGHHQAHHNVGGLPEIMH